MNNIIDVFIAIFGAYFGILEMFCIRLPLFYVLLFATNFDTSSSKAERLKLRVIFDNPTPPRAIKINLYTILADGAQSAAQNAPRAIKNALHKSPYIDGQYEFAMDDIRSMLRIVRVMVYQPNFSKRHLINLGSAEPRGLFWHRRVFVEATANDSGNYHAFLYAIVSKTKRQNNNNNNNNNNNAEAKKFFLGYAPLIKQQKSNEPAAASSSQNQFDEYQLLIPVDLIQLFKHKLGQLELSIFRYDKENFSVEKFNNDQQKETSDKTDNETAAATECSICLCPITNGEQIMKLHGDEHIFHNDCIQRWIKSQKKVRCPLCNREPKLEIELNFSPIFYASPNIYMHLYMNPLKELFKIANGGGYDDAFYDDNFRRRQAQFGTKQIKKRVASKETMLRNLLAQMHFFVNLEEDKKLLHIEEDGTFIAHPMLAQIRSGLGALIVAAQLESAEELISVRALSLIRSANTEASLEANKVIENMQIAREKQKQPSQWWWRNNSNSNLRIKMF
uniref:RING-type domain-containing protein n=1 Tax=Globodera rostochiensis TaxID=31243 RepID=A0A914IF35_GLORO